jgi:hypothetical protein
LTAGMRRLLIFTAGLGVIIGVQLFVLTESTERYFAWTINIPLSAAFLGGAYWGGVTLLMLAARERLWARARIAVPPMVILSIAMLGATFLHLDLFHIRGTAPLAARGAAYGWIASYALVPLGLVVLWVGQRRGPGPQPPRIHRLRRWLRWALGAHGVVLVLLGADLLFLPEQAGSFWPWMLTPLTARAIGAWVLAIGIAAAHWAREDALERTRSVALSFSVFSILEMIALVRYGEAVEWTAPSAWVYCAFLVSILFLGASGTLLAEGRRPRLAGSS